MKAKPAKAEAHSPPINAEAKAVANYAGRALIGWTG